ncbi:MAG: phosphopantetheine-binding protein, partial [Pirellulaceae bacterium]
GSPTPPKRPTVRSPGITQAELESVGVQLVLDSASPDLASELRAVTGGEGLDVVLSFKPLDATASVLSFLAPNGRVIVVGPVVESHDAPIARLHPDTWHTLVDPMEVIDQEPALVQHVLSRLGAFSSGPPVHVVSEAPSTGSLNRDAEFFQQWSQVAPDAHLPLLTDYLQKELAQLLGLDVSQVGVDEPLVHLGVDSLMALELRNRVKPAVGLYISTATFIEGASVTSLAEQLFRQWSEPTSSRILEIEVDDDQDWIEGEV